MRIPGRRAFSALAVVAASSCADLGGLSGGATGDGGAADATAVEAAPPEASSDAGVPSDAPAPLDAPSPPDARSPDADADASLSFFDNFDRPDSSAVGNGWIMKYAPSFSLTGGAVLRLYPDANHDFVDNIVYRPIGDSLMNVEVSIEVKLNADPPGFPQVHARVQPSSVATAGQLDSYLLYVANAASVLHVARQHGGSSGYVDVATLTVSPPLNTQDTFRLRLAVTGTTPVSLTGTVEKLVGGAWTVLQSAAASDVSSDAITTPGTVGFSGGRPESSGIYRFDNFTRTPL